MDKSKKIKVWAFFMRLGDRCGCHQRPDRSFFIGEWQFPVCSRCTGVLTGQGIGVLLYIFNIIIPFYIDFIFLLIMFMDWFIQYKNIRQSTNLRRFITGNLAGIAQVSIIIKIIFGIIKTF